MGSDGEQAKNRTPTLLLSTYLIKSCLSGRDIIADGNRAGYHCPMLDVSAPPYALRLVLIAVTTSILLGLPLASKFRAGLIIFLWITLLWIGPCCTAVYNRKIGFEIGAMSSFLTFEYLLLAMSAVLTILPFKLTGASFHGWESMTASSKGNIHWWPADTAKRNAGGISGEGERHHGE